MPFELKNPGLEVSKNILIWILELAQKNYYFARYWYVYKRRKELQRYNGSPIIVFQMGKVGSKTISKSLKAINSEMKIYHSHLLTMGRIRETERRRKKYFRTEKQSYLKRSWLNLFLHKQISKGLNGKKWKIITLTREPVGRNISAFFENLDIKYLNSNGQYKIKSDYYNIDSIVVKQDDLRELVDFFFSRLNHRSPLEFFDNELHKMFNVDVYANEFPKSKGYKIYHSVKADILLIRVEDLNRVAKQAFKEFLEIDNFSLIDVNVSEEKNYALLYKTFKDKIHLPDSYLDKLYCSKYMQHFYSIEEINNFRSKWSKTNLAGKLI
jgi:hypothetical protein